MNDAVLLNGYQPGDPFVEDPHPSVVERPGGLPEDVDVLIIGCGPAGLVLAAQMAAFPDIRTAVIDRRDGPLEVGEADGVACRTVDTRGSSEYPVTVTLRHMRELEETGETSTIRARYVVGCDDSRSGTRTAIGRETGRRRDERVLGRDGRLGCHRLPDVRVKCAIYSAQGNILIIPREGGYLVRFYIELDEVSDKEMLDNGVSPQRRWPRSRTGSCTRTPSRSETSGGGRRTRSASVSATSSTTCR
jgi:2-polyprenyl-6-methoxyphenol hydroxylase-like FAD-dependent oxidoreductase